MSWHWCFIRQVQRSVHGGAGEFVSSSDSVGNSSSESMAGIGKWKADQGSNGTRGPESPKGTKKKISPVWLVFQVKFNLLSWKSETLKMFYMVATQKFGDSWSNLTMFDVSDGWTVQQATSNYIALISRLRSLKPNWPKWILRWCDLHLGLREVAGQHDKYHTTSTVTIEYDTTPHAV